MRAALGKLSILLQFHQICYRAGFCDLRCQHAVAPTLCDPGGIRVLRNRGMLLELLETHSNGIYDRLDASAQISERQWKGSGKAWKKGLKER